MKMTAILMIMMLLCMANTRAEESIEVTPVEKQVVSEQLDKESERFQDKTRAFFKKISSAFKNSKSSDEVSVGTQKSDCVDCSRKEKTMSFLKKLGLAVGKGAAWVSTTTAKPFSLSAGFIRGSVEKRDKNKDLVALYQFFLNHQDEYDDLYQDAGTSEEMVELMMVKTEEILDKKMNSIMKDFLFISGVRPDMPDNVSKFDLTREEIAKLDLASLDVDLINLHPEFLELKPILGDLSKDDLKDILTSGTFTKSIAYEKYKEAIPSVAEAAGIIAGQIFVPKIALGVISGTMASLYATPVIAADIATGVSAAVCLQKETKEKFGDDKDLKTFCSYVTNRSSYELMKSRAQGYVAGKKFHVKVADKVAAAKAKWAERKRQKELAKQRIEIEEKSRPL